MHKLQLTLITIVLLANAVFAADIPTLLAPYPGKTQKTLFDANEAIIKSGPDTIKTICLQLRPFAPKADLKERYALNGIAKQVMRNDTDGSECKMLATALCEVLPSLDSNSAKRFVIVLLERCGKNESVPVLSTYLHSPELSEVATHALVRIDTPEATTALAQAFVKADGDIKLRLIHALGVKQHQLSTKPLLAMAADEKESNQVHDAALTALSNIGSIEASPLLYKATSTTNSYEFIHSVTRFQHLGETLLAQKKSGDAAVIFRRILTLENDDIDLISGIYSATLNSLVTAVGTDATPDLTAACPDADFALLFKIAQLADPLNTRDQIYAELAKEDIYFNYRLLAIKGSKGDVASTTELLSALKTDTVNCDRIYPLTRTLDKSLVTEALLDLCADSNNIDETIIWTLEMPGDVLYPKLKSSWKTATPAQMVAFIKIVEARRSLDFEDMLLLELDSNSSNVKKAATSALVTMESKKAIAKFSNTYAISESRSERIAALRGIADFSKKNGDISVLTALMISPDNHKEIAPFLASIGGKQALDKIAGLMTSSDPVIQEAAIRSLLKWQKTEAIAQLLKLAKTSDSPKYNAMSLSSIARLAPIQKGTAGVQTLTTAHALAKRPEEKSALASAIFNTVMNKKFTKKLSAQDKELLHNAWDLLDEPQKTKMANKFKLQELPAK